MRCKWLIGASLAGCTAGVDDTGFSPDAWPDLPQVGEPELVLENLSSPAGLALCGDQVCVAEYGAGRVLEESGDVYAEGFLGPWRLASVGEGVVLTDRTAGTVDWIGPASAQRLAEGIDEPMEIAATATRACWSEGATAETGIWCTSMDAGVPELVAEGISGATHLALDEDRLLFATAASEGSIRSLDLDLNEEELLASFGGPVESVMSVDGIIYYSQQQTNWPNGGWVGKLDGSTAIPLSYSPPQPDQLVAMEDWLLWSSHQSISMTSMNGGAYQILADQTAVGGMLVRDSTLYWTDMKSGRLYRLDL